MIRRPALLRRSLLGAAGALPFATLAAAAPLAATPIDRLAVGWWKERHAAKIAEAKRRRVDLVLLGDSITHNLERDGPEPFRDFRPVWQRFFAGRNALNLGFGGDATSHLLWRMRNGELTDLKPKAAVILIGANNMGRLRWKAEDSIEGIHAVVREARSRLAGARIVLMSVLPSERSPWVDETTTTINRALTASYGAGEVIWHDATPVFVKGGKLDRSLFYDDQLRPPEPLIHPTPAAMMTLYTRMEPVLARAMGG